MPIDCAFYNCSGLTSVTIPDSVTSIGNGAFYNCSGLTSVTIENGVTSIVDRMFYKCSNLTSITIPDSVTSIGEYAFSGCSRLTSVTIPDSLRNIERYAFQSCSSLSNVTFESLKVWKCSTSSSMTNTNSVEVPDYYLSNSSTAAIYLTQVYLEYYWVRFGVVVA